MVLQRQLLLLAALTTLILTLVAKADVPDSAGCTELGFTGLQSCSDCETFAEYVKDEELVADCKRCCVKEKQQKTYTSAILEVCSYRLQGLPQLQDFLQKKASKYPNLKVRYELGGYPTLKLKGPSGTEKIRIDSWKMSNIVEFLDEQLAPPATATSK